MKTINVVAAIIIQNGKCFSVQRGYGEYKDYWEFPGGKIEDGESNENALKREIKEELDTIIDVKELFDIIDYTYPTFHLHMYCYLCSIKEGNLHLIEHEDKKWLGKEDIDSVNWLPADKTITEKIKNIL